MKLSLRLALRCREAAPWWAPDKVGELQELPKGREGECAVKMRRSAWAVALKSRYSPESVEWIDSGVEQEKPCTVLLLRPREGSEEGSEELLIVVAFRGSKTTQDYFLTDSSPRFVPLPTADWADIRDVVAANARFMPQLSSSPLPCATMGVWRAYAGSASRAAGGLGPRTSVVRAVERLLQAHPTARLVLTGHSLGGALCTLCAFDLLTNSSAVREVRPRPRAWHPPVITP
jgi:hypothetical protein